MLPEAQRGNNADSLLLKAAALYNKKDYSGALPLLQSSIAGRPDETAFVLATGLCFLKTNQYDSAIKIFDKINEGNSVYKNQGAWYKALTLLKENDIPGCQKLLESIPADSDKFNDAKELMKKIKKIALPSSPKGGN
jgi:tetratricopeptide (TPR) repeat protein